MIGAIVVLYNPDFNITSKALESLIQQVDKICIVDNSLSDNSIQLKRFENIEYIPLRKNIGIAAAQNIGINYFIKLNYDYVIFCDQDSVLPSNLVLSLLNAYNKISNNFKIAAIGPMPINRNNGIPYLYSSNIIEKRIEDDFLYYDMHSIISSCSIVPISNFFEIGFMREELFIDFVEQDWCWRAKYFFDMHVILIPNITIQHELGNYKKIFGLFKANISSSFRLYFQIRNLLWLSRMPYTPRYWKKMNKRKLISKLVYYSVFSSSRWEYIKSIFKGFKDGRNKNLNITYEYEYKCKKSN